jgi:hypothetical protein
MRLLCHYRSGTAGCDIPAIDFVVARAVPCKATDVVN